MDGGIATFEQLRPRLKRLAYRLLGTVSDAEDLVQDAYLRWHQADSAEIKDPEGWLVAVTTRLSIDRLRRQRRQRTEYYGEWLPEPWMEPEEQPGQSEREADLSFAFLVLLDRLRPEERAAIVLREAFERGYAEIGRILGKSVGACQQLVSRGRRRLENEHALLDRDIDAHKPLLEALVAAMRAGDEAKVLALLDARIAVAQDGGGKVHCALNVIRGPEKSARFLARIGAKQVHWTFRILPANGGWGVVVTGEPGYDHTLFIGACGGRITRIYGQFNPEKLGALAVHEAMRGAHG